MHCLAWRTKPQRRRDVSVRRGEQWHEPRRRRPKARRCVRRSKQWQRVHAVVLDVEQVRKEHEDNVEDMAKLFHKMENMKMSDDSLKQVQSYKSQHALTCMLIHQRKTIEHMKHEGVLTDSGQRSGTGEPLDGDVGWSVRHAESGERGLRTA